MILQSSFAREQFTRRQERQLVRLAQTGDRRARNRLVENHLPLVMFALARYINPMTLRMHRDDLMQVGTIGLIKAIDKFRPMDARFATCAMYWVRAEAWRWLRDRRSVVHAMRHHEQWRTMQYDIPIDNAHAVAAPSCSPEEAAEQNESVTFVRESLELFGCSPREKIIIRSRLLEDPPATLEEVGALLHITRERVRQIEARVVPRFKAFLVGRMQ